MTSDRFKRSIGVDPAENYSEIHRSTWGFVTTIFENGLEHYGELALARLRTQEYNGSGRSGITKRAFDWPLDNSAKPIELLVMADAILAAAAPGATQIDQRSPLRKGWDRLCLLRLVNQIPELARVELPVDKRIRVDIYRNRWGTYVSLHQELIKGNITTLRMPSEAIGAWRDWLLKHFDLNGKSAQ